MFTEPPPLFPQPLEYMNREVYFNLLCFARQVLSPSISSNSVIPSRKFENL